MSLAPVEATINPRCSESTLFNLFKSEEQDKPKKNLAGFKLLDSYTCHCGSKEASINGVMIEPLHENMIDINKYSKLTSTCCAICFDCGSIRLNTNDNVIIEEIYE